MSGQEEFKNLKIKKENAVDGLFFDNSGEDKEDAVLERYLCEPRIVLFKWTIFLFLSVLLVRAGYLQIAQFGTYRTAAMGNSMRILSVKSDRGIIYDKKMELMVQNTASLDVVAIPSELPQNEADADAVAKLLSEILDGDENNILKILKSADRKSSSPVLISANIEHEKAIAVETTKEILKGIRIEKNAIRSYNNGIYFSSVLGYTGKVSVDDLKANTNYLMTDYIGKTGLEYFYEKELRGKYGAETIEVDALGQKKRLIEKKDPKSGINLKLNIDSELQMKIYDEIIAESKKTSQRFKKTGVMASAVAIDPRNGGVLAMISMPSYDNNLFAKGISSKDYNALINNPNFPLINRAISGNYPPGSTIKPLIASAALNEKIVSPTRIINCGASISIGRWVYPDWKAHGPINIIDAIAQSSDVFFYTVGGGYGDIKGLGIDNIKKYANLFNLGEKTGIDLPGESAGLIPDAEWKITTKKEDWYIGDEYHASIGQGDVLATPLQLADYIATIANGGTVYKPQIVDAIIDESGKIIEDIQPVVIRKNFIEAKNIKVVQEGMRATITRGTGRSLNELAVTSAGKTGTAQFGLNKDLHSWFVAYAPYKDPEIALVILVEGGGEGNELAVPIAKNVLKWYFEPKEKPL